MLGHLFSSAFRSFWRYRFTTAVNLLALSMGLLCFMVACGIVIFLRSTDAVLPGSDRIYAMTEQILDPRGGSFTGILPATAEPVARYLRADFPALEAVGNIHGGPDKGVTAGGRNFFLSCGFVDPDFAKVFRLPMTSGNPSTAFSRPRSVVLSGETAAKLFGAQDPLGKTIAISGIDVTVTGVLGIIPQPTEFGGPASLNPDDLLATIDVSDALGAPAPEPRAWQSIGTYTYIKLAPGASIGSFVKALPAFAARHLPPHMKARIIFGAVPVRLVYQTFLDAMLRTDKAGISISGLFLILGILVLGVACLNYANLAAAQAHDRLREAGMRKLLGATRTQILGQLLLETAILATAALGIVLAGLALLSPLLQHYLETDVGALLFKQTTFWLLLAAGLTITTFGAGLYPALILSGNPAIAAIQGGRVRRASRLLPTILVGLQFLAASFLLISVMVIARQNDLLRQIAAPTALDNLVVISTPLTEAGLPWPALRDSLRDIRGVRSITAANSQPWSGDVESGSLGRLPTETSHGAEDFESLVADDFFSTIGATLLAGRLFDKSHGDDLAPFKALENGQKADSFNVVIDRSLAGALGWSPSEAVGQTVWRFRVVGMMPLRVIGVVEDRPLHLFGMGARGNLYEYAPLATTYPIIRIARSGEGQTLAAIDDALKKLSPKTALKRDFASDLFNDAQHLFSVISTVFGLLAIFAFIIAVMGLFGMAIHVTSRRTHEIGVRKALGATARNILTLLLWDFSKPVVIAGIAAWPVAYLAASAYLTLFVERTSLTVTPFILSLFITLAIAWAAVGWQALRAAWMNPARILRYE